MILYTQTARINEDSTGISAGMKVKLNTLLNKDVSPIRGKLTENCVALQESAGIRGKYFTLELS